MAGEKKVGVQTYDVFLSYARQDRRVAREIADNLQRQGVKCWLDSEQIKPGDSWAEKIQDGINNSHACMVLLSAASDPSDPTTSRSWCSLQEKAWNQKEFSLCSVDINNVETPPFLRKWESLKLPSTPQEWDIWTTHVKENLLCGTSQSGATVQPDNEQALQVKRFDDLNKLIYIDFPPAKGRTD